MKAKSGFVSYRNCFAVLACAAVTAMVPLSASADVIISDTFSRSGYLNGTAPDVTQTAGDTWTTNANVVGSYITDGTVLNVTANGYSSVLPFTPSAGHMYTLSADIYAGATDDPANAWLAMGFLPSSAGSGPFFYMNAAPWLLVRNTQEVDASYDPAADGFATGSGVAGQSNNYQLILDTTGATDVVSLKVNGVFIGSHTYTSNPQISFVGLGSADNAGVFDNFSVTSEVPEPASLGLLALGGLALLRRRRKGSN